MKENDLQIGQRGYACFRGIIAQTKVKEIIYEANTPLEIATGRTCYHFVYKVERPDWISFLESDDCNSIIERDHFFKNQQELSEYFKIYNNWFK